jgi:hypothetical protein
MVAQAFEGTAPAVDAGVEEVVRRLSDASAREEFAWYIGGSTAAYLLGAEVTPRDLDLGTTRAGVDRIADALAEYLIEPIAPTDWPGGRIVRAARAFVGTFRDGLRVEWAVPIEPREPRAFEEWSGPGVARLTAAARGGRSIRVTRPEYALVRAVEKGQRSGGTAIARLLHRIGVDRPLLETLLERSRLAPEERAALVRELESPTPGPGP